MFSNWLFGLCFAICAYTSFCEPESSPVIFKPSEIQVEEKVSPEKEALPVKGGNTSVTVNFLQVIEEKVEPIPESKGTLNSSDGERTSEVILESVEEERKIKGEPSLEVDVTDASSSDDASTAFYIEATASSNDDEFTTIMAESRKMNCTISDKSKYSWIVKIIDKETREQVCVGTLITDEDILVPASCFLENTTAPVKDNFYDAPEHIYAIAGGGIDSDCMQIRNVTAIYPHKAYLTHTEGEHDYAYLKVEPEFIVDEENIPNLHYHTTVVSSEGSLVDVHNRSPFCESPYFVDEGINARVSEEHHLMGMRIEECMGRWNCSADFNGCLSFLHPSTFACLKSLTPRNCSAKDRGAPLICDDIFLGYLDICDGDLPLIFRGLNRAIKFLEMEEDHVQNPSYFGVGYY